MIKTCPFCGLFAEVKKEKSFAGWVGFRVVCGARSDMECEIKPSTSLYKKKKDAIEVWEKRH